jgi:hypothetical protein
MEIEFGRKIKDLRLFMAFLKKKCAKEYVIKAI